MDQRQYTAFVGMALLSLCSVFSITHTAMAADQVESVVFSQERGFYTYAFYLILTNSTPDATVYYTTDGSEPIPETAQIALDHNQAFPIIVDQTTCVRAMAVKPGSTASKVSTHTYIFLDDLITELQAQDAELMQDALLALPSIFLSTDQLPTTQKETESVSVEWLEPDTDQTFQLNAALSLRMDTRLKQATDKPSFHVRFDTPLPDIHLFETLNTDTLDGFDLYANPDDTWASGDDDPYVSYIRDVFSHDLQLQTGQPGLHNRFCHMYVNGQYQGLYQLQESIESVAGRTNPDSELDGIDILRTDPNTGLTQAFQGTLDAWKRLYNEMQAGFDDTDTYYRIQGMNPDGRINPGYERLLDIDNLIDFMIVEYVTGDTDGPGSRLNQGLPNHVLALYNEDEPDGFKWIQYDNTWSLGMGDLNTPLSSQTNMVAPLAMITMQGLEGFSCHTLHEHLMAAHSDYRMRFADRVHLYLSDNGILTKNPMRMTWLTRVSEIQDAIPAEASRWAQGSDSQLAWLTELKRIQILNQDHQGQSDSRLLAERTHTVLEQFKTQGWYPDITAPQLSEPSGLVQPGSAITLSLDQGTLYLTLDGTDPRAPGGSINVTAQPYTAPITITDTTRIKVRALLGQTWSTLTEATFVTQDMTGSLRISEIMPSPLAPDTDFIELTNIGSDPINLDRVRLSEAIDFIMPAMTLMPNDFVLVVEDIEAFETLYGPSLPIAGQYKGQLDNSSERIVLEDATGQTILDFTYDTAWYAITQNQDFSLTVRPGAITNQALYSDADSWRPSHSQAGSPGGNDIAQTPVQGSVIINEILSHSHDIASDWVELYNPTNAPINVGGWMLSDDDHDLLKYEIAYGTLIPAKGYLVLYEIEHFGNPFNAGTIQPFALSENGENLYVSSALDGELTGFQIEESFGASSTGIPFGRHETSNDRYDFVFMQTPTPGQANSDPLVGPVVISEIMYHPSSDEDAEYIELINISDHLVTLYDPFIPLGWRFYDDADGSGIFVNFPVNPGLELQPNERLLLVKDETTLRRRYTIPETVNILEWPSGKLSNSGEKIQLDMPGDVDLAGQRYWILVDRVNFSDGSHPDGLGTDLWPAGPDGRGWSLQRITLNAYGNDPINWQAGTPTPGW